MRSAFRAALAAVAIGAVAIVPEIVNADPPLPAAGSVLPAGATFYVVLDERINSRSTTIGSTVRAHLRDALVAGTHAVAAAGTPTTLAVVATRRAATPDIDGTVTVRLAPLRLADGSELPVGLPKELLSIEASNAQRSANAGLDTAKDIIIPLHQIYRQFRHGSDLDLRPGTVLRARTLAGVDAADPAKLSIATPAPFILSTDRPYAAYTPVPLFTLAPRPSPSPARSAVPATALPATSPTVAASPN